MSTELLIGLILVGWWWMASRRSTMPSGPDGPDLFEEARAAAERAGIDPAVFLAIIYVESGWRPTATNLSGPDGARGGAYGLGQITLKTAQAFEPSITGEELLDPWTNLRIAELLLVDIARTSTEPRDVAAIWNSGRTYSRAPDSTRNVYVPAVLKAMSNYTPELLAVELES